VGRAGLSDAGCHRRARGLLILDHDGHLGLATATRDRLKVHSRHRITETESLTSPTLVGTTLFVRDEKQIMAFDLGAGPERRSSREARAPTGADAPPDASARRRIVL